MNFIKKIIQNMTKKDDKNLKDLEKEVEELQENEEKNSEENEENNEESSENNSSKYDELNDRFIRLIAEFENFKRRTREESLASYSNWAKDILSLIVPFFDNFKRAMDSCEEELLENEWVKWIFSIEKDLLKELEKKWLKKLEIKWEKFNANKMEALMQDPKIKKDIVSQVFEDWYEFNWKTVRFAKVSVWSK